MSGRLVVGVTGASGATYGRGVVAALLAAECEIDLVVSEPARRVAREELDGDWSEAACSKWFGAAAARIRHHASDDIGAAVASGSAPVRGMVVAPCSMGSAGRIAAGLSDALLERAADVQLKERRPLVLVVRETPLSLLHLQNLTRLAQAGATILPAAPGFYARPATIDDLVAFIVERAVAALGISAPRRIEWRGESAP